MAVATYGEAYYGRAELYRELRDVFDQDVVPTSLHRFFARCARLARERDSRPALIVTTNYDDLLERALNDEAETYNVVAYVADGPDAGKFRHYRPDGERVFLRDPRRSQAIVPWMDEQTTILKIHGTFDPNDEKLDSYVISENQYIEYLTTDIWDAIPIALIARLRETPSPLPRLRDARLEPHGRPGRRVPRPARRAGAGRARPLSLLPGGDDLLAGSRDPEAAQVVAAG